MAEEPKKIKNRSLPESTIKKKFIIQHGRCFYCGENLSDPFEIDHILPWSKHKNGTVSNMWLTCVSCNRLKRNLNLCDFKAVVISNYNHKLIRGMFYYEFTNIYNG